MRILAKNLWMIVTLLSIVSFGLVRAIYIAEADILWQTKMGLDLFPGWDFKREETYSWSITEGEYVSNSWLWNVVLAISYSIGGFVGIAALTGMFVSGFLGLVVYYLRLRNLTWFQVFIAMALVWLLMNMWLSGRPQIVDYILLMAGIILCHKIELKERKNHLMLFAGFAIFIILWENFHLTAPVGALLFSAFYFLKQSDNFTRWSQWRSLLKPIRNSIFMLLGLILFCFITPYGVEGVTKTLVTSSASHGIISEWMSPWEMKEFLHVFALIAIIGFALCIVPLYKNKHFLKALFLLGLVVIASIQVRWVPFLIVAGLPFCVSTFSKGISRVPSKYLVYLKTIAFAVATVGLVFGLVAFVPQNRVSGAGYGYDIVQEVPADCKLLNDPTFGGPLILTRPEVKVSVDGRNDFYDLEDYITQNNVLYNATGSDQWLEDNGITCVLLTKNNSLEELLVTLPEWEQVFLDERGSSLWQKTTK